MQNVIVDIPVEVSSLTEDAINHIAGTVQKTPAQIAAFLLSKGFSNLFRRNAAPTKSFGSKVLATFPCP